MTISTKFLKGCDGSIHLNKVTVRLADSTEREQWNKLIIKHHYLGNANLTGRQLRYVAECRGKCVALIGFSAAALKLEYRDKWIGWDNGQKAQRLNFVAQNSRFMIMPDINTKNLASRVMSLCRKRLADDWMINFNHPLLMIETFVDKKYPGTSYRADNWLRLGETKGYTRQGKGFYVENGSPKSLWIKELVPKAGEILRQDKLPEELAKHELPLPANVITKGLNSKILGTLWDALNSIKDHRGRKGRRHNLASCLALVICGTLAGAKGLSACVELAKNLSQPQRRALTMLRHPGKKTYIHPSHSALHTILSGVDPEEFESCFLQWFNAQGDKFPAALAIDGKALRATLNSKGDGLHAVSAICHDGSPFLPRPQSRTKGTRERPQET